MSQKVIDHDELTDLLVGVDSSANFTSDVLDLGDKRNISIHIYTASGSPSGTWTIQGSNVNDDARFQDITSAAASSGDLLDDRQTSVRFIRIKWVGSGVGTISAVVASKA